MLWNPQHEYRYHQIVLPEDPTAQDLFDFIARHLFTQGARSADDRGQCLYREQTQNLKCAIGAVIPDDAYNLDMEGNTIYALCTYNMVTLPKYISKYQRLLGNLQEVHDYKCNWESTQDMRCALKRVGKNRNLDTTILDSLYFIGR